MSDINEMNVGMKWYVVHTYSGYENKVKANLEKIVENRGVQHLITEVQIPTEIILENDGNSEKEIESKLLPSYILVKMIMCDESWHIVRNIRGVTGFVGPGSKPVPLTEDEVAALGVEKHSVEVGYSEGDTVKIINGPLEGYSGVIKSIDLANNNVCVVLSMFGRETPVELELDQISLDV